MIDVELFDLQTGENLIIKKQVSYVKISFGLPQPNPGNLSITNRRILFKPTQGRLSSAFICNLEDISSYSVGLLNTINILTKTGEKYKLTGLFNKELINALAKLNIKKTEK